MKTLLLFLFLPSLSFACLHADQNRIFPIGQSKLGLHVLEVYQTRSDSDYGAEWKCDGFHKIYNENHDVVHTDTLKTKGFFPQSSYINVIQMLFLKAHKMAKASNSFSLLTPKSLYFCGYVQDNADAKLTFDTINEKVFVQLISGKKHEITNVKNIRGLASSFLLFTNPEQQVVENLVSKLAPSLRVNSVRKFNMGQRQLTIVHVGIGQILRNGNGEYPEPQGYFLMKQISHVFDAIFFEDVLHHGSGFDFMIWE